MKSPTLSEEAVQNATDKGWDAWFALLEEMGAQALSHKEIAQRLQDEHAVSGWWAQSIAVEYERFIGRREVGQMSTGDYQASASKTLSGTIDAALDGWQAHVATVTDFDGVALADAPSVSKTDNWRYWRVNLVDGSKLTLVIGQKSADKSQLAINHEKLADAEAVERWKAYWRAVLQMVESSD